VITNPYAIHSLSGELSRLKSLRAAHGISPSVKTLETAMEIEEVAGIQGNEHGNNLETKMK